MEPFMMNRRRFLFSAAVAAGAAIAQPVLGQIAGQVAGRKPLTRKQRVDRALAGRDVDRPPFTHWHHFGPQTPEVHAKATLDYHWKYRTDIVKVMSDYPYPKPAGNWYDLKVLDNPFPDQIRALELIRDGLNGDAYILETTFNPWQVAVKLSSKEEVLRLQQENPQRLLDALDVITQSSIHHAKRAFGAGASGILFSIANAKRNELSPADYARFSLPFDKRFFDATSSAKLSFLHLHWENEYVDQFVGFQAPVVNWSVQTSGVQVRTVRGKFSQTIATGIDEVKYKDLTPAQIREQWLSASSAAGSKFILTPGCSVPNDSTDEELSRLPLVLGA
jgi:uroporphyrinogen decarboxylase